MDESIDGVPQGSLSQPRRFLARHGRRRAIGIASGLCLGLLVAGFARSAFVHAAERDAKPISLGRPGSISELRIEVREPFILQVALSVAFEMVGDRALAMEATGMNRPGPVAIPVPVRLRIDRIDGGTASTMKDIEIRRALHKIGYGESHITLDIHRDGMAGGIYVVRVETLEPIPVLAGREVTVEAYPLRLK